jgi:hypothetical protein
VSGKAATATLDFLLRLVFFATAPFLLVFVAALFPVTGALVQIGLALVVFFAGEAAHRLAARSKLTKLLLGSQLAFDVYYRQHPPKPFLYYVFYPLLAPYWLAKPEARHEFLLYKGYTLASFLLLIVSLVVQYIRFFPPELTVVDFLPIAAGTLVAEAVVVLMFLLPIVTTVVHFHTTGARLRLTALLIVGALSVTAAIVRLELPRDPVVSFATRARVRLRAQARPSGATQAESQALRVAWKALPKEKGDIDTDGKVEGDALEKARDALLGFYKTDEAHAFDIWFTRRGKSAVTVLYFEARGRHAPIWLALDQAGLVFHDPKRLPRGAFVAMKQAADAAE